MKTVEENVAAEYVRNPDYWKPGKPYFEGFRTRHFPGNQTGYSAFLAGEVDVALLAGTDTKAYIDKQGPGFTPGGRTRPSTHSSTPTRKSSR